MKVINVLLILLLLLVFVITTILVTQNWTLEVSQSPDGPLIHTSVLKPTIHYCSDFKGGKIMEEIYKELGLKYINSDKAAIYLPCGYTYAERELKSMKPYRGQKILAIDGCDFICAKNSLWLVLLYTFGMDQATKLTPESYIPTLDKDMQRLTLKHRNNPDQLYVMKKNVQKQQGLKITNDINELHNAAKDGYIVIQEYIMNPLLFDDRKFDVRIYLLVIKKDGKKSFYLHSGGRCHYTSEEFNPQALDMKIHVPSGYEEDTQFKDTHPETLKDLRHFMNEYVYPNSGNEFFDNLEQMLRKCCQAFVKVLGNDKRYDNNDITMCQLFGIDIVITDELEPMLIEINKGPELAWNTEREHTYKKQIVDDMFELIGYPKVSRPESNEFKLLIEI